MVDLNGKLRLHADFKVSTLKIGDEGRPVVVVDNFLSSPELLVDYAAAQSIFDNVSDAFYPGSRAPVPPIYCFSIRAFLGATISEAFGLGDSTVTGELSHFSLITTPPESLKLVQRMPHYDNPNPKQLAVLHYLCRPTHGGTSFYRHRRTRFEYVDEARSQLFGNALAAELAAFGSPPAQYICGDNLLFERTCSIPAVFNRLLIYQSINLHSADIGPEFSFHSSPRQGRLTANSFFFYR